MFKAVTNLKEQKGFTLIELLIVIAIIGILAAIAIPAFLGQREKAKIRSVEASCKGAVAEVQSILDAYISGSAFLLLDGSGNECCWDATTATPSKKCSSMYSDVTDCGDYTDILSVRDLIINHHKGKEEKSPYVGSADLFVVQNPPPATVAQPGQCGIANRGERSFTVKGYASSTVLGTEIINTTVTSR